MLRKKIQKKKEKLLYLFYYAKILRLMRNLEKVAKKTPFLQSAKLLVTNWQNIVVLLVYFVMGCANGFHATYLFLFLQQLGNFIIKY